MSYEGYEQYLCENGHYWEEGCSYGNEDPIPCADCGKPPVWVHSVDTTNDEGEPVVLKLKTPSKLETCPTCQHTKEVTPETYEIPPEGVGRMITYPNQS